MNEEPASNEVRKNSERFGKLPNAAEGFGTFPNDAETFGSVPRASDRKESHTLTVREVARLFEEAGVSRTERSIINWCQPNKLGVARLDCYLDPNERKYFVTPQSVTLAIKEEQAKASKEAPAPRVDGAPSTPDSRTVVRTAEPRLDTEEVKTLKQEIMDLKITNRGKDFFIEQLQNEREGFAVERQGYVDKLMSFNRKVGELESKLLQLSPPQDHSPTIQRADEANADVASQD
jgi:hypothetical protein